MRSSTHNSNLNPAQRYPVKLLAILAFLIAATGPVSADTDQNLANAIDAFKEAKAAVSYRVNTLPQTQRAAIWTQYYRALEHLQTMTIHNKMMEQHNEDRSEQFLKSHAEFTDALEKLYDLLPAPG